MESQTFFAHDKFDRDFTNYVYISENKITT